MPDLFPQGKIRPTSSAIPAPLVSRLPIIIGVWHRIIVSRLHSGRKREITWLTGTQEEMNLTSFSNNCLIDKEDDYKNFIYLGYAGFGKAI